MSEKIPTEKSKKKRKKEDEYFAKEEAKKIAVQRERLDKERADAEEKHYKETCWMRCPKCGGKLREIEHQKVMIDKCDACGGLWLDAGELDMIKSSGETGFLQGFFKSAKKA